MGYDGATRRVAIPLLIWLGLSAAAHAGQLGALETDCRLVRANRAGGIQLVPTCKGRAPSPDGRLVVVQRAYRTKQPVIELQRSRGALVGKLPSLSDDMPMQVYWAPNSQWFFVNHHVGSFMDVLQVFEVTGRGVFERPALVRSAISLARKRYPCLPRDSVLPNGVRWSRDGRRIMIFTVSRADACSDDPRGRTWRSLWVIGEVRSGHIDARSVRVQRDDGEPSEPVDRVYLNF